MKRNTLLTLGALFALTLPATQGAILLVADPDANTVWQVNEAGVTSEFANLGAGNSPTGVAAAGGAVFVLDRGNETIHRYSSDGMWQSSFISVGVSAIAVDLLGNVYAASLLDDTVTKYNAGGGQLAQVTVDAPTALAVSSAGEVFIAETTINGLEIRQYSASLGSPVSFIAPTNDPEGLAFRDNTLYGAIGLEGTVEDYSGVAPVDFVEFLNFPLALVFADNGELFIADGGLVQRYTAAGVSMGPFGTGFTSVSGLAFTTVPEAGSYAMIGGGLLLLGFMKRKR